MKKIVGFALSFALSLGVSFAQQEEIKKAKRQLDIDHTAQAVALLEPAIARYPKAGNVYYYLGYAQLRNNQLDEAARSFDAGIAKFPKEAINYAGKGHLQLIQKRSADAIANLNKALQLSKSKKVPVLKAVAEAYLSDRSTAAKAVPLLQKAKSIDNDAEVEILLGDALLMQNQGGPAASAYENAALLDPKSGKPHYKIGSIYSRVNPTLSLQSFEKSVAVDPEFTASYDELADIYYQQKEPQKAVAAAEKFRQLSSDPDKIQMRLAFIYVMNGEYAKANAIFASQLKKETVKPLVYRYYIRSLQATQLPQDSLESVKISEQFLAKALVEDLSARDFVDLGKLYIALNQDSLGELQLKRAIAFDPESTEAAQLHAEMLYKSKRYEEAAEAYEKLVEVKDKPSPNEYLNLARAYSISEQYEEADTVYVKLVEQYPTNIQVAVESARVKANIDSTQDDGLAKPLYEKVIELAEVAPDKYKVYMIEAYKYMGSYYAIQEGNVPKGKAYFEKVLTLNPDDSQAKEVLEAIRAGQMQPGKKTG